MLFPFKERELQDSGKDEFISRNGGARLGALGQVWRDVADDHRFAVNGSIDSPGSVPAWTNLVVFFHCPL